MYTMLRYVTFFCWIIIIEELMECIYKSTKLYKNRMKNINKFTHVIPEMLEIINIGSGPGIYDITYKYSKKRGFNFSTSPQNFQYGFRILKKYQNKLLNNCIVIIVVCPLSFGDNLQYYKREYSDQYYYFLAPEDIDNYSRIRALLIKRPLIIDALNIKKRLVNKIKGHFIKHNIEGNSLLNGWRKDFNLKDLKNSEQSIKHKESFEKKINVLVNIINYCRNQKWRPLLVIPPVAPNTREYIGNEFMEKFCYENIKKVCDEVGDIQVLDFYNNEIFIEKMFKDPIFLNEEGQILFSETLFQRIDEIDKLI